MQALLDVLIISTKAFFGPLAVFYALMAIGLNIHFGYTGLLNFGQIGFAMLGGFGIAISVTTYDLPFAVGLLVGLLAAVLFALILGLPTLRLRADYLAIVTIAAAEILRLLFRSVSATPITGATRGLSGFAGDFYALSPFETSARYTILGARWSGRELWVVTVGWSLVALGCLTVWLLMRSPWGRVIKAIREDEDAARSLGKNVYAYKMQSLILGGIFGALGGMIYALATSSANPDQYQSANTFLAYAALILGGTARVLGPVIGAMIFWFLLAFTESGLVELTGADGLIPPEILSSTDVAQIRFVLVGVGLMLLLIFRPQGIFGDRREVMLDAR
jgi:branched-chain amino acid transport system permease protein